MNVLLKKFINFILCLGIWFVGKIFPVDYCYYEQLILPSFAPPSAFYSIAWIITYILIAYSMYNIFINYSFKKIPLVYKITILINYLFNQSFILLFFGLKSNLLGFISCLGTFISALFLYQESLLLKEKSTLALRLYVLLSAFAVILSLSIYFLNI